MDDSDIMIVDGPRGNDDSLIVMGVDPPPQGGKNGPMDTTALLARLDRHIQERNQRNETALEEMYTKREVEKAHGQYLRENFSTPQGKAEADFAARVWSRKNGINTAVLDKRNAQKRKRTPTQGVQPLATQGQASVAIPQVQEPERPAQNKPGDVNRSEHFRCPVLNCEAKFSSLCRFNQHMTNFFHTPCHPFLHQPDMKLKAEVNTFICPLCGNTYTERQHCLDHMQAVGHNIAASPLHVGGYACPQCLLVFSCKPSCSEHMRDNHHNNFIYPFKDDASIDPHPIPFPTSLVDEFSDSCVGQAWYMECMECDCKVMRGREGQEHFNKKHTIVAFTTSTPADVFSKYLCAYTCIQCLHLFKDLPQEGLGAIHKCDATNLGMMVDNDCKSFEEFVLRTALTLAHEGPTESRKSHDGIAEKSGTSDEPLVISEDVQSSESDLNIQGAICKTMTSLSVDENAATSLMPTEDTSTAAIARKGILGEFKIPKLAIPTSNVPDKALEHSTQCKRPRIDKNNATDVDTSSESTSKDRSLKVSGSNMRRKKPPSSTVTNISHKNSTAWKESVSAHRMIPGNNPAVTKCNSHYLAVDNGGKGTSNREKTRNKRGILGAYPGYDANSALTLISAVGQTALDKLNVGLDSKPDSRTHSKGFVNKNNTDKSAALPRNASRQRPVHVPFAFGGPAQTMNRQTNSEPTNLETMKQIVFLDLDNWAGFFSRLPGPLPALTFVWGFYGGRMEWREPLRVPAFEVCKSNGWFHLHNKCGFTKDAADFALCLQVGRMDERLPKNIPFTILSGDRGFCELERQMKNSSRRAVVINPHHQTPEMVYTLIMSVGDA